MRTYRHFCWFFFLLVPLLWLVWPSVDKAGREEAPQAGFGTRKHHLGDGARVRGAGGGAEAGAGKVPRRVKSGEDLANLTGVDRVLANDGISHEQAALQLRELAMNPMSSVEDRLEALQHGLNLHPASFGDFAQQKDLPSELASHYLHEIINDNDSPAIRIRSYMALMDHPDAEVAGLARDMLAMEVGNEEEEPNREKLLMDAQGKLATLAAEGGN